MSRRAVVAGLSVAAVAAVAGVWFATRRVPARETSRAAGAEVRDGSWTVLVERGEARILTPTRLPTFVGEQAALLSLVRAGALEIEPVGQRLQRVALPEGEKPVVAGAPVVPLGGSMAIPLSRAAAPTDAVMLVDAASAPRTVDLPAGLRVVAARATTPPELVLTGPGDGGSIAIVRAVLREDGQIEERDRATVPYTPSLVADPSPDQRCGLDGERYFPLIGRAPTGGVLVAITDTQLYPLRFARGARATVTPVCGACPPIAVSRDGDEVSLLVTVGRKLAKSSFAELPERPVRDASGACTAGRTVVVVAAGDGLYAASTPREGGWKLNAPVRIEGPAPGGPPVEARVVGHSDRLTVFFRRANAQRVEQRTSTDGGATWR